MKLHERLAAIRSARLDAVNKSILSVLAGYAADDEDRPVWPSVVTIAADAGVNKDTVTARMTALAGLGLIVQTRKHGMGQNARYRVAWNLVSTCDARPARRSVIARQDPTVPDLVTASDDEQDPTGSDDKIRPDRISRSDGVGREDPTGSDITIHENRSEGTDQANHPSARDDEPTLERPMPTNHLGSRPTETTAAADNGEVMTPPSVPAVSSPWRTMGDSAAVRLFAAIDASHADVLNDDYPMEMIDAEIRESGGDPDAIADRMETMARSAIARASSTLSAAPATSDPSASIATEGGLLPLAFDAPPAKPKRKAKTAPDETQIAAIAADVERAIGAIGRCKPGSMRWKQLANAVKGAGVERMAARIAAFADAVQGLPSPAAQTHRAMATKGCDIDNLLWAENGWTLSIDKAIEDAAISRSEAVAASGGMLTHPSAQNAPERQAAPKQNVSWPDVLRDLGSDPQTHPEDGPHRTAWQSVRQAVLVSTKKAGDPWLLWCNADDRTRQHVEGLLNRGLVK